jgi:hypothetical protein
MPSPFPGMDPYIEAMNRWADFHQEFLVQCRAQLNERLPENYAATLGERIEMIEDREFDRRQRSVGPDVTILHDPGTVARPAKETLPVGMLEPTTLANDIEYFDPPKQVYVEITYLPDDRVVTDIELLSPSNKRRGSRDRAAYLAKRQNLIIHEVNLVEIGLLVGGERMPMRDPLPAADYFVLITQGPQWGQSDVYSWSVRDPLPTIPIPLKPEDGTVPLELAPAFAQTYDHGRYGRLLRYGRPLPSGLSNADQVWAQGLTPR